MRHVTARGPERPVFLALLAVAVNAVLIQTIVPAESSLKNLVRAGALALAVIGLLVRGTPIPRWIVGLVGLLVALTALRHNPDLLSYVFILVLAPALWAVPEQRLERMMVICSLVSIGLVFAFLAAGVTHNEVLSYRGRATYGTRGVPFFFNLVYGACAMGVLYAVKHQLRRRRMVVVVALVAATYFYRQTDIRGGYFAFMAFLGLLWAAPRLARSGLFRGVVALLPPVFLGLALLGARYSSNTALNDVTSHRLVTYHAFLANVSPLDLLLSSSVKHFDALIPVGTLVSTATSVDNSYLHLLVGGGIVMCAVFVVLWRRALAALFDLGRYPEIAFLVATSLYFSTESILVRVENVFVIYAWYLVLRYSRSDVRLQAEAADEPRRRPGERAGCRDARRQARGLSSQPRR